MKFANWLKNNLPASWRHRIEMAQARRLEALLIAASPPDTREAHESGAVQCYMQEMSEIHQWRRELITANYRRKADALSVLFPGYQDEVYWEEVENELTQQTLRCLSPKGEAMLKAAIREERKHRREAVGYWFGIAVGLIGAITGLVSVFKA
ncbi:hypothetical protein IFT80_02360 [Pseudomonas sp. CFBP 8771]|uniref:hypothetical protein n=1 Tax=Pseudomonas sp. CFBP 8771 TaxID=2775285 RepID=UPI001787027A|nr:hypothetical protein [Pseudomonas sp. CFBP 8771]MBD8601479.1 hypothetical protein [Pseudomonas sp. CFBP 8771]